jgi:actin-related protein
LNKKNDQEMELEKEEQEEKRLKAEKKKQYRLNKKSADEEQKIKELEEQKRIKAEKEKTRRSSTNRNVSKNILLPKKILNPRNIADFMVTPSDQEIIDAANVLVLDPEHYQTKPCSICAERMIKGDTKEISLGQVLLTGIAQSSIYIPGADVHNLNSADLLLVCSSCHRTLQKNEIPLFSIHRVPVVDQIPEELKNLTILEKMLISRNRPVNIIIKLSSSQYQDSELKQRGLRGNVIAFPQDIGQVNANLNLELPQLIREDSILKLLEILMMKKKRQGKF